MACNLYTLSGIGTQCKDSAGGVKKVLVGKFEDLAYTPVEASAPYNTVTVAAVGTKEVEGETVAKELADVLHVYSIRRNTSSMTSTLNVSENAGNSFTTEINLQFLKAEAAKRLEIMGLMMSESRVIVKDANNQWYALGYDYPVEASAGTQETGTAISDFSGYNLTLQDNSAALPYHITNAEVIAELEAIVAPA